jgi:hypothetical protein
MLLREYYSTNNSNLYKRLRKNYLYKKGRICDFYVSYHRLENRTKKGWTGDGNCHIDYFPIVTYKTTWKKLRVKQYHESCLVRQWPKNIFHSAR